MNVSGGATASFVFNGDGNRVKATVGATTTAFVGAYEWTSNGNTLYYSAGGARVAMRRSGYTSDNGLFWILGDHLGSTSIVANADGSLKSMLLYKAWGEVRYSTGVANTKYTFTGQYQHVSDFGLMYYVARWYDPALGRFAQADTMGEGDRYAYVNNNPARFTDPTGHHCETSEECENDPIPPAQTQPPDDGGYNEETEENWDDVDRTDRACQVWSWMCHSSGWWNGNTTGCPSIESLAAWLFENEASGFDPTGQEIVARAIMYILTGQGELPLSRTYLKDENGNDVEITQEGLAYFTSFINPDLGTTFTSDDWAKLNTEPGLDWAGVKAKYPGENPVSYQVDGKWFYVHHWAKQKEFDDIGKPYPTNYYYKGPSTTGEIFYFTYYGIP